ncbi:uncharacterized protein LOC102569738 isoform X3 [Alligator mississippiensis]|uniref:uncharacterized protein LOC102569738 isoform X3 n=1 Tax=Alligator mississippiensis TaxID=8496 RepID=UPI002877555F|nr:uncharacterized protein LOC102569738 isoform X3 [Alligator mississippiensis]
MIGVSRASSAVSLFSHCRSSPVTSPPPSLPPRAGRSSRHLAVASSPLLWGSSRSCTMSTWPGSGPGCGSGLRSNWARARALDKPKPSPPPIKAFAAAWGVASSWVPRGDHVPILLSVPLAPGSGHRLEGHSVAASPARMDLKVVAVSFLLLVLCSDSGP